MKISRNAPCPCGSGLKYKKCKCIQYHPTNVNKEENKLIGLRALNLTPEEENGFLKMVDDVKALYAEERQHSKCVLTKITPSILKDSDIVASGAMDNGRPVVRISSGLISKYASLVNERFPDDLIHRYFSVGSDAKKIRESILDTIFEKTIFHEYYHWFRGHPYWAGENNDYPAYGFETEKEQDLYNLNQQSIEYDADRYAVNMLVTMATQKQLRNDDILCVLLAFSTITYRANYAQSSNTGFDFSNYSDRLVKSHPLPSLRYYYLQRYFLKRIEEKKEFSYDRKTLDDIAQTAYDMEKEIMNLQSKEFLFLNTAYTSRVLEHHAVVVNHLRDLINSIDQYSEVNYLGAPESWESETIEEDIKFDNNGDSLM